ncbi:MAG: hypothetical protein KF763_13065 [Cyclobacteriaceae bacterium]|nr:hypothetical protein [Cyclobacteriaceae bacterium]
MPHHLHDCVQKLNKINKLYDYSILNARQYRIGKIRTLYLKMFEFANVHFGINDFSSNSYIELFGRNEDLEAILQKKKEAIDSNEYEVAAGLRDKEKVFLYALLSEFGVSSSTKFFIVDGKIYKI